MTPKPSEAHDAGYYQDILKVLRVNGILLPFVVVAAGLLIKTGVLSQASYINDAWFAAVSAGFIVVAIAYYATPNLTPRSFFAFSCAYHGLAILFLAGVSGVFSPFALLWIMLFVGLDRYFGSSALPLSMSALAVAGALDITLHPGIEPSAKAAIILTVIFMFVICIALSQMRAINDRERIDLAHSHHREAFQRDRLIALINSMSDAVFSTNDRGVIKVYNAAVLDLLDTHINLNNKRLQNIFKVTDESGKSVDLLAQAKKSNTAFTREDILLKLEDGESLSLSASVSPIRLSYHTHGDLGFIFIIRDITKQKSLEEERDEFISVVSHELRTPVAIAEGNVSNVRLLRAKGLPQAAVDHALDEAHEQIVYLAKMVNDLSTLSRAERGLDATPEQIDLHELLNSLYRKYASKAGKKGLHLDLDAPGRLPPITTSRLYLEEILQNFITNAIKYTKTGSITLSGQQTKEGVRLSVADTGIGISKSDQKHIFEKFYRSEDYRTRESSGTGLGLYVSKKVAVKMGAEIGFESRLNHGSVFTLTLPAIKQAETRKLKQHSKAA